MPKTIDVLDELKARSKDALAKWTELVEKRTEVRSAFEARIASADNKPTEAEVDAFNTDEATYVADEEKLDTEVKALKKRVKEQEKLEERRLEAEEGGKGSPAVVTREPMTYSRENSLGEMGTSYYRDLAAVSVQGLTFQSTDFSQSMARLQKHAKEMEVEMPKRNRRRDNNALVQVEEAEGGAVEGDVFHRGRVEHAPELVRRGRNWAHNPFDYRTGRGAGTGALEQRVTPNSTDGQGGFFIPPLWLEEQWIQQLVAGRVAAGLVRNMDLPAGTNSINIPKVATGTAVGYQAVNNAGVVTQDWTDTSVQANVKTIAGDSDIAIQLLEQSPNGIVDDMITSNLMLQYNAFLDQQIIAGAGTNTGQLNGGFLQGIANGTNTAPYSSWSGVNGVTYTASSPNAVPSDLIQVTAAMASNVAKTRFAPGDYLTLMYPSRWFWYASGLDGGTTGRPFGETQDAFNPAALIREGFQAEGLVGTLPHVANTPVYISANVPNTVNSNQDLAIGGLWDDAYLFEGAMRTNVYREVLSANLAVRFQVYSYAAFLLRYGQSFAIATGTGFYPPQAKNVTSIVY